MAGNRRSGWVKTTGYNMSPKDANAPQRMARAARGTRESAAALPIPQQQMRAKLSKQLLMCTLR
jgi:hypothetical protein